MTDVEQWCIDQEYIGIENTAERNIKIFHDYKQSHSYEDYVKLVKEEHADAVETRPLAFINDFFNLSTKVYYDGTMVGEIVSKKNNLQFISYEGIGDDEYPVISDILDSNWTTDEITESYRKFDKYVIDGEYLLSDSRNNSIDELYWQMIRRSHGIPQ